MSQKREQLASSIHKSAARFLHAEFPGEYVTVTEVEVAPDASAATVWISILNDIRREELFAHAQTMEGKVRTRIAADIQMRRTPAITLKLDQRHQHAQAIEDTLRDEQQTDDHG